MHICLHPNHKATIRTIFYVAFKKYMVYAGNLCDCNCNLSIHKIGSSSEFVSIFTLFVVYSQVSRELFNNWITYLFRTRFNWFEYNYAVGNPLFCIVMVFQLLYFFPHWFLASNYSCIFHFIVVRSQEIYELFTLSFWQLFQLINWLWTLYNHYGFK